MANRILLSTLACSLLLFTSCNDEQQELTATGQGIQFTSNISGSVNTRAANATWDPDDSIGIYMLAHQHGATTIELENAYNQNVPYKTTDGGATATFSASDNTPPLEFPLNGSKVNFMAYYPHKEDVHDFFNHIYQVNVSEQGWPSAIDLLYCYTQTPYTKDSGSVPLQFKHQLSKLVFNIKPGASMSLAMDDAKASLTGFPTTAKFALADGSLHDLGDVNTPETPIEIVKTLSESEQLVFEAIIIPHLASDYPASMGNPRMFHFVMNGESYTYKLSDSRDMEQGTSYTYNMTLTDNGLILSEITISDWTGGAISWGDHMLTANKTTVELSSETTSDQSVIIATTSENFPNIVVSGSKTDAMVGAPDWLTASLLQRDGDMAEEMTRSSKEGWTDYTLNITTTDATTLAGPRTAYIHITVVGLTMVIEVNQTSVYIEEPSTTSFIVPFEDTSIYSFTVETNSRNGLDLSYSENENGSDATISAPDWLIVDKSSTTDSQTGVTTWRIAFYTTSPSSSILLQRINSAQENSTVYLLLRAGTETDEKIVRIIKAPATTITDRLANCYMVPPCGTIQFPGTRAISHGGSPYETEKMTITKLWDDDVTNGGVVASHSESITLNDDWMISVTVGSTPGNAVIAAQIDGVTYWSWHIWVTPRISAMWTNNGFTFMDRNLGATEAANSLAGRGLLYQWGRKDPFPGGKAGMAGHAALSAFKGMPDAGSPALVTVESYDDNSDSQIEGIRNPTTFYIPRNEYQQNNDWHPTSWNTAWGHDTTNDPCPAGWRVPSFEATLAASPWYGLENPYTWTGSDTGGVSHWGTNFPAAGSRSIKAAYRDGGTYGCYWTASIPTEETFKAINFDFGHDASISILSESDRAHAFSIRCVMEQSQSAIELLE